MLDSYIILSAQQIQTNKVSENVEPLSEVHGWPSSLKQSWMEYIPSNIRIVPFPTREYTDDEFQSIIKNVMGVLYV